MRTHVSLISAGIILMCLGFHVGSADTYAFPEKPYARLGKGTVFELIRRGPWRGNAARKIDLGLLVTLSLLAMSVCVAASRLLAKYL